MPGDTPTTTARFYVPSRARALLENLMPSRARGGIQRNLRDDEFEEYLVTLLDSGGTENFNEIRDQARALAPQLKAEEEFKTLDRLMGALLGTQKTRFASQAAKVRASGADKACTERLQALFSHLKSLTFQNCPHRRRGRSVNRQPSSNPTSPISSRARNSLPRRHSGSSTAARHRSIAPPTVTTSLRPTVF